ncbi:multidrug efflux SMR transporter [Roseibium sp. HPY-6]|uniref:DMT family transporter n=1 Tax=Roseibium sp. HPY-6 TaxID=3229852 RepID=UPI00339040F2
MAWVYLGLAALLEVAFVLSMKASKGFTVFWPSLATVVGVIGGIGFLTLALKTLPIGIGYPIWVGVGTLGSVVLGILIFGEAMSVPKILGVTFIILGVVSLKLATPA